MFGQFWFFVFFFNTKINLKFWFLIFPGFLTIFFCIVCSIVDQQQNPEEYVNIIVEQVDSQPVEFAFNNQQNNEDGNRKSPEIDSKKQKIFFGVCVWMVALWDLKKNGCILKFQSDCILKFQSDWTLKFKKMVAFWNSEEIAL